MARRYGPRKGRERREGRGGGEKKKKNRRGRRKGGKERRALSRARSSEGVAGGLARGYDRSTSDSKEAPVLRATPQCSNSIDYCCRCTCYPALANRTSMPRFQAPSQLPAAARKVFRPATFHVRKFVRETVGPATEQC